MTQKRFTSVYNEQSDMIQYVDILKEEPNKWSICNVSGTLQKLNALHEENEQLKKELDKMELVNEMLSMDFSNSEHELWRENEQLKNELKEFKDYVYSDEKILCYFCANCLKKGIYEVECSEKGKVDVHGTCFLYWKNEVKE